MSNNRRHTINKLKKIISKQTGTTENLVLQICFIVLTPEEIFQQCTTASLCNGLLLRGIHGLL